MGPSWTAAPSRSTSLARAKSVRAEAAVVANLAAVVAVAVAVAATRKSARFYPARFGGNSASLFSYIIPLTRPEGHPPHEPRGTSNIEHPTPNIEWQRDSSLTSAFVVRCWTFDVFPRFRVSTPEFSFRGILSPSDGERDRVRGLRKSCRAHSIGW